MHLTKNALRLFDAEASGETALSADAGQSLSGETQPESSDAGSEQTEDRRAAYRALIHGSYKDLYTEDTQRMIDRRFKDMKRLQEREASLAPILQALGVRYSVPPDDFAALSQALSEEALAQTEATAHAAAAETARRSAALEQLLAWKRQAEAMQEAEPSFDLRTEAKNPLFVRLLRAGADVKAAYRATHLDELLQLAAAKTEQRVISNVRARGKRPAENGASAQSAFTCRDDARKLTKKERSEIARRAARGEVIHF